MKKRVILGIICLLIGITPAITFLIFGNAQYIVWFSNHTFIIIGIALLLNSRFLVFAELCLGLIPEAYWSIDFLSKLLTGKFLFGTTAYMFTNGFNWVHLYSLQHLLFVPMIILALCILGGPIKRAWIGSLIHMSILFFVSRLFPVKYNLNCVFNSSFLPVHFTKYYQIIWPIFILINIFLVYFVFMKFFKKKNIKYKKNKDIKYGKKKK